MKLTREDFETGWTVIALGLSLHEEDHLGVLPLITSGSVFGGIPEHASLRSDLSEMTFQRINKSKNEVLEAAW
jgi:hypothetical protein